MVGIGYRMQQGLWAGGPNPGLEADGIPEEMVSCLRRRSADLSPRVGVLSFLLCVTEAVVRGCSVPPH